METFLIEAILKSIAIIIFIMSIVPLIFLMFATLAGLIMYGIAKVAEWVVHNVRKISFR